MTDPALRLDGKSALVTGGGSRGDGIGNGRAAAILLARHGARVAVIDANPEWAQRTVDLIHVEGGEALAIGADVTVDEQVRNAVAAAASAFGDPQIVVNNVGIAGPPGAAEDVDLDAWDSGLRVNVTSMMLTVRHTVPPMRAAGDGSIINTASIFGLLGGHHALLYPTSKAAVIGMTRAMAAHYGKDGVRVNCVAPGPVYTPMVNAGGMTDELREERASQGSLLTEGTGWDVGAGVLYLASPMARWVTGIVLPIDAGISAGTRRDIHGVN